MLERLIGGLDFGESPRWHEGRLWYSDFYQRAVYAVARDGEREAVHSGLPDQPSGLGWLPDGTLLVVSMCDRKVLREERGQLVEHADLATVAPAECNDMVVDAGGNAYVGNFGYHYIGGGRPPTADLALVRPDGSVSVAATDLHFPNGSVITPDGSTLIVGETFGGGFEAFTIADDATLGERRRWADTPGCGPDGCTLDAEGAIWFADALGAQVIRVLEGGEVTDSIPTPMASFACMLGGYDGRTLFVLCAPASMPEELAGRAGGFIYTVTVDIPHAGRP
ncbi:MAG TPA: SMP-30/gluconolactonase/LRE family protein [Acidimicrobiales bacterium]|nr:SMP-30/gluconolactonase/LRE family protein [Acidimicrobiales bacterium]